MQETFYQGPKDVFLTKVRADFDAVEDQAVRAVSNLESNGLLNSETKTDGLFTEITEVTDEGNRAVWRHVAVAGLQQLGTRHAGGVYAEGSFPRGYETVVTDPDLQDASEFAVPEERSDAESSKYKMALNRAQKLVIEARRKNMGDPFEILNYAFVAPTSFPSTKFVAKGNNGLNGANTALNEKLITTSHALASGLAPSAGVSNGIANSTNWAAFNPTYYYAALEQATTFVDDVGKPMPMFGGMKATLVPNANGLVQTAKQIEGSEWTVGNSNNEINVLKSEVGRIISSPYFTNSINGSAVINAENKKWFLADLSSQDPQVGTGLVRVCFVPTESRVERREPTDALVYKLKQSYSYVFVDWRNVIGSLGDGTATSATITP